jgi:hypothetical protein
MTKMEDKYRNEMSKHDYDEMIDLLSMEKDADSCCAGGDRTISSSSSSTHGYTDALI